MISTVIEVKPHPRGGWVVFEMPGVEPWFTGDRAKEQALYYAGECRTGGRRGEIRVFDESGLQVERVIAFNGRGHYPHA